MTSMTSSAVADDDDAKYGNNCNSSNDTIDNGSSLSSSTAGWPQPPPPSPRSAAEKATGAGELVTNTAAWQHQGEEMESGEHPASATVAAAEYTHGQGDQSSNSNAIGGGGGDEIIIASTTNNGNLTTLSLVHDAATISNNDPTKSTTHALPFTSSSWARTVGGGGDVESLELLHRDDDYDDNNNNNQHLGDYFVGGSGIRREYDEGDDSMEDYLESRRTGGDNNNYCKNFVSSFNDNNHDDNEGGTTTMTSSRGFLQQQQQQQQAMDDTIQQQQHYPIVDSRKMAEGVVSLKQPTTTVNEQILLLGNNNEQSNILAIMSSQQPTSPPPSWHNTDNGSNNEENSSSFSILSSAVSKRGGRQHHSIKSLPKIHTILRPNLPPPSPSSQQQQLYQTQFLAPEYHHQQQHHQQQQQRDIDEYKRVTFDGTIIDQINAVPLSMEEGDDEGRSYSTYSNGRLPIMMMDDYSTKDEKRAARKERKKGRTEGSSDPSYGVHRTERKRKKSSRKSDSMDNNVGTGMDNSLSTTTAVGTEVVDYPPRIGYTYASRSSTTSTTMTTTTTTSTTARTLPDFAPKTQRYKVISDSKPNRICNPLLSLPQFPQGANPPIEDIPQGGELWNIVELHFHDPDTYPVAYLARVLGFDIPDDGIGQEFGGNFDIMSIRRMVDYGEHDVMTIPIRGTFGNRVWKKIDNDVGGGGGGGVAIMSGVHDNSSNNYNGMYDDMKLTHTDPLYMNILSSFCGYNDDEFKDAGKGFMDDLSSHCLDYAKERGILPSPSIVANLQQQQGLKFRFATEMDETMLVALSGKCRWKSHPKHDIATSLRSQNCFFIIAESSCNPIAFLQYRFCWYKAEEKRRGTVSTEKISELVIFIDNLVYANDNDVDDMTSCSPSDMEIAKVLLVSLALVHACRANIWYGMMESPSTLVPFITKYFRMSYVRGEELNCNLTTIPLVLDIKKCHFKYAILLLEESLMSAPACQRPSHDVCTDRMIVNFCKDASNSAVEATVPRLFSNLSHNEAELKRAHLRLVRHPGTDNMDLLSAHRGEGEASENVLLPIKPSVIDASIDWKVVKLFSLGDASQIMNGDKEDVSESRDVASDIFLVELKKKQAELSALESSIENVGRIVLSKAYNEHTAFVTGDQRAKRVLDEKRVEEYKAVQRKLEEAEMAWQAQLDQDMDAVCDVCFDGEVTPENQIIFCDACNVAVHQGCYGIEQIPSGNYFCHTCTYFEIDKEYLAAKRRDGPPMKITRPPIVCELCPRRQGAFVHAETSGPTDKAKWCHVSCAKWSGMQYVEKYKIEDLTPLKQFFKSQAVTCVLCNSGVGALHICREGGCGKYMHVTCARSCGECSVQHGENCEGFYDAETLDNPPWTLACPKHSKVDPDSAQEGQISMSIEQLVAMAKSYPLEPIAPKSFSKMNADERKAYLSDKKNLEDFFAKVMNSIDGAKCAVCEFPADPTLDKRCDKCGIFSHADCSDTARGDEATCLICRFNDENIANGRYEVPQCHMCCHPNGIGPLVKTIAKPVSMKKWKMNMLAFQRSFFGNNKFCHALCGLWNPICNTDNKDGGLIVNCSNIAMSNGKDHVSHQYRCTLCGLYNGAKVECSVTGCVAPGGRRNPCKFHITCARQAGLEVQADDFTLKCFLHAGCTFVLRARLEDLREVELVRFSGKTFKPQTPIPWSHASTLFHASVNIMRTLGWAWRWAEWWVEHGDNWEPLLEDGQVEEEMTEKELKIVHSDPESRCKDARQCRLAAFGAALRNRDYDKEDGDDQMPLERALTAVMSTKSLVGQMNKKEIDFFVTWLALAYRSNSSILGFGVDKTPVASDSFCLHQEDGSPKYELGSRPLPGKAEPLKGIFETEVDEVDDFLKTPVVISPTKSKKRKASTKSLSPQVVNDTISAGAIKKRKKGRSLNSIQVLEFSSPATASKKPKEMKSPELTPVLDSTASWTCHNCDVANPESKKRCSGCKSWRGGKRST